MGRIAAEGNRTEVAGAVDRTRNVSGAGGSFRVELLGLQVRHDVGHILGGQPELAGAQHERAAEVLA